MTFIEMNGRAYLQYVHPQSEAAAAGILPQDAVQYAMLQSRIAQNDSEAWCQEVLGAKQKEMRTSYDDLRSLGNALDPNQSDFLSPPCGGKENKSV